MKQVRPTQEQTAALTPKNVLEVLVPPPTITVRQHLRQQYLDWLNNYLTVALFAEHRGVTTERANRIIKAGRALHIKHVARLLGSKS